MEFCLECGTRVDNYGSSCPSCNADLTQFKPAKELERPAKSLEMPAKSLPAFSTQVEERVKFCGDCGAENREQSKFCRNCGFSMDGNQNLQQFSQNNMGYQPRTQPSHYQPRINQAQPMYQQPADQAYFTHQGKVPPSFNHPKLKSVGLAFIVSLFIPGFAYMYTGKVGSGILYFFITFFTYSIGIGLFIHIYMLYACKKWVDLYNWDLFVQTSNRGMY